MNSLFIALPLNPSIKTQIQRLCCGIPNVHWTEHSHFHLTLLYIGPVDGALQLDIQEALAKIRFAPFPLTLQGVGYFPSKKNKGAIWAGVAPSQELTSFQKLIDHRLKEILPKQDRQLFIPHITLGRFENVDQRRLSDYLESNSFFITSSFINEAFVLMKSQNTPSEKTIYQELVRLPLTPPINKLHILND